MADFLGLMKKAQEMQTKVQAVQAEVDEAMVDGQAGAGVVKVTMNGRGVLKSVSIDPSLLQPSEQEVLEDLILAASQDARKKADALLEEKMKDATSGLPLPPGFKLPF